MLFDQNQLDNLASIQDGLRTIFSAPVSRAEGASIGFLRFKDLTGTWIQHRDSYIWHAPDELKLEAGDVILSRHAAEEGTRGKRFRTALIGQEHAGMSYSSDLYRIRLTPRNRIKPGYLAALLASDQMQEQMLTLAQGKGILRLSTKALKSLKLPDVSMAEQIAVCRAYEEANEINWLANQQIQDTLSKFNARVGQWLLSQGSKGIERLEHLAVLEEVNFKRNSENTVRLIRPGSLNSTFFYFAHADSVNAAELSAKARHQVRPDQVLLMRSGSNLGQPSHGVAVVTADMAEAIISLDFHVLSFKHTPYVHAALLKHPFVLEQIRRKLRGEVICHLNREDVLSLMLPNLTEHSLEWEHRLGQAVKLHHQARNLQMDTLQRLSQNLQFN